MIAWLGIPSVTCVSKVFFFFSKLLSLLVLSSHEDIIRLVHLVDPLMSNRCRVPVCGQSKSNLAGSEPFNSVGMAWQLQLILHTKAPLLVPFYFIFFF
jgi:hypothetical protein